MLAQFINCALKWEGQHDSACFKQYEQSQDVVRLLHPSLHSAAMAAQSDPTRWHWPTVLRTALARSTSRTWSNHTPRARPLHSMTAKRVAAPSLRGYPSCRTTKSRSFRLHNGRRRHLKPYASSFASEGSSVQTAPWPLKHSTKIVMVDCAYCISLWIKSVSLMYFNVSEENRRMDHLCKGCSHLH